MLEPEEVEAAVPDVVVTIPLGWEFFHEADQLVLEELQEPGVTERVLMSEHVGGPNPLIGMWQRALAMALVKMLKDDRFGAFHQYSRKAAERMLDEGGRPLVGKQIFDVKLSLSARDVPL